MIYLAKLARRLSQFKAPSFFVVLALAGCSKGVVTDYLGPNPNSRTLASVKIDPPSATARTGQGTQFSASGVGTRGEAMATKIGRAHV